MSLKTTFFVFVLLFNSCIFMTIVSEDIDPNQLKFYVSHQSLALLQNQEDLKQRFFWKTNFQKTKFQLWVQEKGPDDYFEFSSTSVPDDFLKHGFRTDRETKILCGGFTTKGPRFSKPFVKAYFANNYNVNIITVDHRDLDSWAINYFAAASNIGKLGVFVGDLLTKSIIEKLNYSPDKIHIIGHSLGAHLAGHIGRKIQTANTKNESVGRVTALDPAGPYFSLTSLENRVQPTDAKIVDVMHTNSGSLIKGKLSLEDRCGHFDFYPNGGSLQPGCADKLCILGLICLSSNLLDIFNSGCSHSRAVDYYIESIKNQSADSSFVAASCSSWEDFQQSHCPSRDPLVMGEVLQPNSTTFDGLKFSAFYLITGSQSPFAKPLSKKSDDKN